MARGVHRGVQVNTPLRRGLLGLAIVGVIVTISAIVLGDRNITVGVVIAILAAAAFMVAVSWVANRKRPTTE